MPARRGQEITRNPGLPAGVDGKIGVAVSGADPNRVYAVVENENGGLFSSDDAGATWKLANGGRNIRQRAFYYSHVTADPHNKDLVYVLNVGTFRSTDGGKTLGQYAGGDSHDLWIDPDDSNHVMHASDSGGAISYNGLAAQAQFTARDYPTGQFYHVITTKHVPYHVCGAQQDGSTVCIPSNTNLGAAGGRGGGGGGGGGGRGGAAQPATVQPGRLRTGLRRARSQGSRTSSLPEASTAPFSSGPIAARARHAKSRPYPLEFSGQPSSELEGTHPVDVPDHLFAGRSERALHRHPARVEDHQRRPDVGSRSAAISAGTTPRPWATRAGRSPTT